MIPFTGYRALYLKGTLLLLMLGMLVAGFSPDPYPGPDTESEVPEIKLQIQNLGNGYSSPAVTEKQIFVSGEKDSLGYLMAFDWQGNKIWENCYGPEWTLSYRGSRAEPVLDESRIYVCSGQGVLSCFDSESGRRIWTVDLIHDLRGLNVSYGYSMPVLIDGDRLFCSPGGEENNIVALDKYTGDLLWTSPGVGESAGYAKPLVVERGGLKILMTFSEFTFLGLNAETGELLWSRELNFKGELPCNQPVYQEGEIYIVAGPGNGAFAYHLSRDGKSIKKRWSNLQFNSFFGGFVLQEDYLIGAAESKRSYVSLNKKTGKIKSQLRFGIGAIIETNDYMISYNQQGHCGIISMHEGLLSLEKEFRINGGSGEHFAMPVIFRDMLFIRHGNTLLVYEV